jgi:hypothetical protein
MMNPAHRLLLSAFAMTHTTLLLGAELPVRQVVLYKNGVGYFERAGDLAAGQSARLDFKAGEMNDVLKSLSIFQKGGGPVTGLRYDSSEPITQKLGEFPFKVEAGQPLSAFLDQLRGARVDLKMINGDAAGGTVLSARRLPADAQRNERELLMLQVDTGELKQFDLGLMASLKFSDPALELELKRFLATLTASRSRDKKSIYIDSTDDKARSLAMTYMIPMPVWKSSYRLIFGATGEPTLEGWAIVDNTTGEDWDKVQLALVSGRPVSFISKLYEPKYVTRQTAELAESAVAAPVLYDAAMATPPPPPPSPMPMAEGLRRSRAKFSAEADAAPMLLGMAAGAPSSVAVNTASRDLGDLFEYRFGTPVTVKKNESAMLPFLQQKLGARKLLIYTHGQPNQNPMSSAEITNSSGKTLDGGPITVFDANAYAGEALMETLKASDKRLISYAVDLGTRVTTNIDSGYDIVREIKAINGVILSKSAIESKTTYSIRNVDAKAKTLVVQHPLRADHKFLGNLKPAETTANHHRFEVKLAPNATESFVVSEERVYDQSVSVTDLDVNQLLVFIRNKNLSAAARKQLEAIIAKKNELTKAQEAFGRIENEINVLVKDQDRIRQNLTALNRVAGQEAQVRKYSSDLAASEAKLAALRDQLSETQRRQQQLDEELDALAAKLEF